MVGVNFKAPGDDAEQVGSAHQLPHSVRALREHLKRVLLGQQHRGEYLSYEQRRYVVVEQVTDGVDEHAPRFPPLRRHRQPLRVQLHRAKERPTELSRDPFGVAVVATERDAIATRDRIPRRIGPLDCALRAHSFAFVFWASGYPAAVMDTRLL